MAFDSGPGMPVLSQLQFQVIQMVACAGGKVMATGAPWRAHVIPAGLYWVECYAGSGTVEKLVAHPAGQVLLSTEYSKGTGRK